jgi:hypothetical protein
MIDARKEGQSVVRIRGWEFIHTIRLTVLDNNSYVTLFGIQIGPVSFYWTNPFAGD